MVQFVSAEHLRSETFGHSLVLLNSNDWGLSASEAVACPLTSGSAESVLFALGARHDLQLAGLQPAAGRPGMLPPSGLDTAMPCADFARNVRAETFLFMDQPDAGAGYRRSVARIHEAAAGVRESAN